MWSYSKPTDQFGANDWKEQIWNIASGDAIYGDNLGVTDGAAPASVYGRLDRAPRNAGSALGPF